MTNPMCDYRSNPVRFPVGRPKPLYGPKDDGLVHRLPEPASILLHPVLLHMSGFLVRCPDISFSNHGACVPRVVVYFRPIMPTVQTRVSHVDRPTLVKMHRARDEQRRIRYLPCTTDLRNIAHPPSIPGITTSIQQIIYSKASKITYIVYGIFKRISSTTKASEQQ
jgi:hypothetical protein